MDKSPDAFRTISEVAGDLDLPQHVLRFWETRFNQIRPLKRGGGRRYYRPDDVDLLKGIRHLLYGEGYTIRGVQRILKEQGVRFVTDVWREGAPQPSRSGGLDRDHDDGRDEPAALTHRADDGVGADTPFDDAEPWEVAPPGDIDPAGSDLDGAGRIEPVLSSAAPPPLDPEIRAAHVLAQRFAPRHPAGASDPRASVRIVPPPAPAPVAPEPPRVGLGHLLDRLRPGGSPMSMATPVLAPVVAPPPALTAPGNGEGSLSRDDVRRLQATLFELLECKRLLDQVR